MVYDTTLSESQRVMSWRLILEEFWPNIQHITRVDNIVADILSRLSYTSVDKYETSTSKAECCVNELFASGKEENKEDFPAKYLNCAKRTTKGSEKN